MGYKLSNEQVNELFQNLKKDYRIFAPKRFKKQGRYSDTDIIRYDEVDMVEDIVYKEKSHYSAKEVLTPINQTIFYFTEDEFKESKLKDNRGILIFLRPCDINAIERQDKIYLENGFEDFFYKRIRDKVKFIMMECVEGWDTCFCTAMNSNKTDNYSMAVRFEDDGLLFEVKDKEFDSYFIKRPEADFQVQFIEKNQAEVNVPKIPNKEVLKKVKEHPMWKEYDKRCEGWGSCTVACPTCTCFTTMDVMYNENANVGERRRIMSSCNIDGFDQVAGGHIFRSTVGDRMRYKVLHKVYDFKERFGENMCVGCGRCTSRCPQFISMTATINKLNNAVTEIINEK